MAEVRGPAVRGWPAVLAAIPAVMLTLGVPLANRVEPRILGLPFLLCWIVGWIILTPLFLYGVFVLEGRAHGRFAKRRNVERPS